jgi:hypothetical protein
LAENHEFCIVSVEQPLQQLHADARESVAVGDHNFVDSAATNGVQKREQAGALPVESTASVADELVVGASALQIGALALEIRALRLAADAGVANASACARFEVRTHVLEAVEAFAVALAGAHGPDLALVSPAAQRGIADIVCLAHSRPTHVRHLRISQQPRQTRGHTEK